MGDVNWPLRIPNHPYQGQVYPFNVLNSCTPEKIQPEIPSFGLIDFIVAIQTKSARKSYDVVMML